jgi:CheY-like chemotaxis protein
MPHKLLLADDSVTIQKVIELTFADEDIRVIAVGDGRLAIERIESERPDIVLADIGMPERDGYEVAAFVKHHPDLKHVPVLLLTGAFEPIDEGRAKEAGCDGVLVKPFEPQMVINRVKDLLAGRQPAGMWVAASQLAPPHAPPTPPPAAAPGLAAPAEQKAGGALDEYFDRLDAALGGRDSSPEAPTFTPPVRVSAPDVSVSALGDPLAGWDPDLAGDPVRPAAELEPPAFDLALPGPLPVPPLPLKPVEPPMPPEPSVPEPPAASLPAPPVPQSPPPTPVLRPATAVTEPVEALKAPAGAEPAPGPAVPRGATLAEAFAALLSAERGQPIAPASVRPQDIPDATIDDIVQRVIERMGTTAVRETVADIAERLVREEIERIKRGS